MKVLLDENLEYSAIVAALRNERWRVELVSVAMHPGLPDDLVLTRLRDFPGYVLVTGNTRDFFRTMDGVWGCCVLCLDLRNPDASDVVRSIKSLVLTDSFSTQRERSGWIIRMSRTRAEAYRLADRTNRKSFSVGKDRLFRDTA